MDNFPEQDKDKLFSDIMNLIENSKNNSPALVGVMLVSIGTSLLIDMSPSMTLGMTVALDAMKTGIEDSLKYEQEKIEK